VPRVSKESIPRPPRVILFSYRNAASKLSTALFSYVTAEARNAGYTDHESVSMYHLLRRAANSTCDLPDGT
jgi:hypothetical protein